MQCNLLGGSEDLHREDVNHLLNSPASPDVHRNLLGGSGDLHRDDVNHILNSPASPDVHRNLFGSSVDLHCEDVHHILNSPASLGVVVNQMALSGANATRSRVFDHSISAAMGVSAVELRSADDTSASATPYSGYQDVMRAADVMKATRGREVRGDATPHPPAPDRPIDETPRSDPLYEYAVSGHGRGMSPSPGGLSPGMAPSRGRGRGGMNSAPPNTGGLNVRWQSGTAEGRGLVPTNLFGQAESDVLAKFRVFVRQVPDSQVDQRCNSR